jgi:Carboxypeptidase regulatory-like domain
MTLALGTLSVYRPIPKEQIGRILALAMAALPKIGIASPCPANWNLMAGDDQVRYCPDCRLNVYNFSAMTSLEIQQIVAARTGRLCARFYQRPDGTMLTKNCPVGFRAAIRQTSRVAIAALTALVSIAPAFAKPRQAQPPSSQAQAAINGFTLQVVDPSGAAIADAAISIVDEKTGKRTDALTDAVGKLHFAEVPFDSYDVTISSPGFVPSHQTHLQASRRLITVQLQLGTLMGDVVFLTLVEPGPIPDKLADLIQPSALPNQLATPVQSTAATSNSDLWTICRRVMSKLRGTL